jgi:maltose/moltooligosaccharide transporter
MSAVSTTSPHVPGSREQKIFKVGTLSYTQKELYVLFFWLMWNDFTITLLQDPIGFGGFLQKDHGATNTQIAIFGTIGGIINVLINPIFSVWSDRTRTVWGRRRPFLLLGTPPLALFIVSMPYMPTLEHYLLRFPLMNSMFHAIPMDGAAFMVGICTLGITIFNSIVGTLFSYLYWDVVPQEVLGRWTSMTKIVGAIGGFLWQFFFFGMADQHLKALCFGVSIFALAVYLLSVWKVKEGEYPPVDKHKKGGPGFASIRAYFVECFSDPFYLWIFAGFAFASINWGTDNYIGFYLKYNLHLNYTSMGEVKAWPGILTIVLGYFLGSMTDRLHPMRIFVPSFCVLGMIYVGSFFFVHDKWSFLFWTCLTTIGQFANGVTYGALLPQIFPREKFGQFCSANACCSMLVNMVLGIPLGWMFDLLNSNYRYGYLVAAFSMFGAAALFVKVHRNFDARHGKIPVPHAG